MIQPLGTPTQIYMIFLGLYVTVLTTCYSGNLTAFLTVERPRATIETVRELYSSGLDVVTVGYFFKVSLEESGNIYLKGLASRYKGLSSYQESYNSLERGEAVLLETRTYLQYLVATDFTINGKPSMRIMKECYAPYSIAIALQKNFPLKKSFDKILGWLYDAGILQKWFLNLLRMTRVSKTAKKQDEAQGLINVTGTPEFEEAGGGRLGENGPIALSVNHLQGIFYIHLAGLVLSTALFLSETLFRCGNCQSRRITRKQHY
ncbi:ionotropic receptor 93a-like [Macrobrachium nipponense]|uniref:ionotropic receptor 93a-like n=1 Tax=Macrobrachium nipponense TaxID=159736 RepID=UPI0030C7BD97